MLLHGFNLSNANIINEDNEVVLTLRHKYVTGFDGTPLGDEDNDYMICFRLADVYSLEERITMLETENEQLRSSQEVQVEAIIELASIITEYEVCVWQNYTQNELKTVR